MVRTEAFAEGEMAVVESAANEVFAGLENAETALPERWVQFRDRATDVAFAVVIAVVQLVWLAAFGVAACRFIF
jgi:hypothetical protein